METNQHHLFYFRRAYSKTHERQFRNYPGLVIPVDVRAHRDLHHHMFYGPPKPTRGQMAALTEILAATPQDERNGYWGALVAAEFFRGEVDHQSPRVAERSARIANHLDRQLGFVAVEAMAYAA